MIKQFFILILFLVVLTGVIAAHYSTFDERKHKEMIGRVSSLAKLSSPSLSTAYYEPRLLILDKAANPSYPDMPAIDRTDFIYEK